MFDVLVVPILVGAGLGSGLLLYWAIRYEERRRDPMPRSDAERLARRDTATSRSSDSVEDRPRTDDRQG